MRKLYLFLVGFLMAQQLAAHPGFNRVLDSLPSDSLRPDITSFSPKVGGPGTIVYISGKRLAGTTSVRFGGVPAANFLAFADTLIRATVGNGGSGSVQVANAAGSDSLSGFRFIANPAPPQVTSFSPNRGRLGDTIRIRGARFYDVNLVTFGGEPAARFFRLSDTLVLAVLGAGNSGVVSVYTPWGVGSAPGFTYVRDTLPPTITRFTPTQSTAGHNVAIFGRHFFGTTQVSFGNVPARSFTVLSDTMITAVVGNGASGFVKVRTAVGVDSLSGFVYGPVAPVIHSFSPASGTAGTIVNIFGRNLSITNSVRFGGVPAASFTIVNDSLIQATVGAGASGAVVVAGVARADTACCFTFLADSTGPAITRFSPVRGGTGTQVTIVGSNFINTTSVSFGGVPALSYTVNGDSLITAFVGNGASGIVQVTTTAGSDTACCFQYLTDTIPGDSAKPIITVFYPRAARSGQQVDISGKNFTGATSVSFGGVAASSFQVITDTLIYAIVGNGASGAIRVANPFGWDTACCFAYIPAVDSSRPSIITFRPSSARSGQRVEIFGRHFTGTNAVTFGGTPAQFFQVITDTLIYAIVGNGSSGLVRVAKGFNDDTACCFAYIPAVDSSAPVINNFNPKVGTHNTVVTIFGRHFTGTTAVRFGRIPAKQFSVLSDTVISAIVDTGATGLVEVRKPNGRDSLGTFTYVPADTLYTLNVAPNPARHSTIVTHPRIGTASQLKLSNMSGHVIRTVWVAPWVTQTRLNLTGVRPGVYKIGWTNGRKWYSQTILIQ